MGAGVAALSRARALVLLRPRVTCATLRRTDASRPSLWTRALWTLRPTIGRAPHLGKWTDGPCASRRAVLVTCALPHASHRHCKVAGHASWSCMWIGVPGHHILCPSPSFANRAEPTVPDTAANEAPHGHPICSLELHKQAIAQQNHGLSAIGAEADCRPPRRRRPLPEAPPPQLPSRIGRR
jgi:hypothetical protein